ncbi:MAG: protein translocase subunit SecF [Patescibacteria group bacterium]
MFIIKYRKVWYAFSLIIVIASLFSIFKFGLKQGIDFTGGALMEMEYASKPDIIAIRQKIGELSLGNALVQPSGDKNIIVRMKDLTENQHQQVLSTALSVGQGKEIRFDSIGPVIGKELKNKSITAMILVMIMIVLYIAFAFRKVSKPISSFYYGLMAVVALIHDVTLPAGVFAFLGHYYGVEVDTLFVTALLTVLGFSVHDTIVVFDRIRENLKDGGNKNDFEKVVGSSVNQTIGRSINTSLTVILVLLAMFFLGGESTKYFSLALLIGVAIGTYSSIFLASPLLVTIQKLKTRK